MTLDAAPHPPLPEPWLRQLRERFVTVARRRASQDDVEDLVQEALGVVASKGSAEAYRTGGETPRLEWCFQVLRNVLGNHYQKQRTRAGEEPDTDLAQLAGGETPFEALHRRQVEELLKQSLRELRRVEDPCAALLEGVIAGNAPATMAEEAEVSPAIFYRRLYRCRQKLRRLLEEKGVIA